MLRVLSIASLASAAIIAAIPNSPASAAAVSINSVGTSGRVGAVTNGRHFAPNTRALNVQTPRHVPRQKRWVCGPIVNWDGSPHCHWVP